MSGYRLDPFRNIVGVNFATGIIPWYFVISAGQLDNDMGADPATDIYVTRSVGAPYYVSTFNTQIWTGYMSMERSVQKAQLPYDVNTVVLGDLPFGTVSTAPRAVGSSTSDFDAMIGHISVGDAHVDHQDDGFSITDALNISLHDDGSLALDLTTPFIGYYMHVRSGDDPTDDPSTDMGGSTVACAHTFPFQGDGHFNRGANHYYFPDFNANADVIFSNGASYTFLFNGTPHP